MSKMRLVINSTLMFVLTSVAEMTLHEAGHFIAGLVFHTKPVLYHNYVANTIDACEKTKIIFASAGPLVSLVLGIVSYLLLRVTDISSAFLRLFFWYFSIAGFIGFFGYLLVAPFFSYGDTGFVLRALSFPPWVVIVSAVTGLLMLVICIRMLAPYAVSFMSTEVANDIKKRGQFVSELIFLPLLFGIPILALLNLPTPTFLSILAPLMSPWSVMYAYGYYLKGKPSRIGFDDRITIAGAMPMLWYILFVIIVVINRLLVYSFAF